MVAYRWGTWHGSRQTHTCHRQPPYDPFACLSCIWLNKQQHISLDQRTSSLNILDRIVVLLEWIQSVVDENSTTYPVRWYFLSNTSHTNSNHHAAINLVIFWLKSIDWNNVIISGLLDVMSPLSDVMYSFPGQRKLCLYDKVLTFESVPNYWNELKNRIIMLALQLP